jgi:hypothetical protein
LSFWATIINLIQPKSCESIVICFKNIQCRFGAWGSSTGAHIDHLRTTLAMFHGSKRYIVFPPFECKSLFLHPRGHPECLMACKCARLTR